MTIGTDFISSLPAHAGPVREQAILDAVRAGSFAPFAWATLTSQANGHSATFYVMSDALRIGTQDDSVRVNVCARTAQQLADVLGCILPTTRLCDLVWGQAAVRVTPCIGGHGSDMADTARMVAHNACVDAKVQGQAGLVETVGKNWVLTNQLALHPGKAANYGWFDPSAPDHSGPGGHGPYRLWQPLGLAHDLAHVDYSQIVRLVSRSCVVDSDPKDIVDVMRDPALAGLVSDEGPMRLVRIPGVAAVAAISQVT